LIGNSAPILLAAPYAILTLDYAKLTGAQAAPVQLSLRFRIAAMGDGERKGQRLIACCMLGLVLFNFPVLALFNVGGTLFGVPVLYAYIFVAWAGLIALMALLAESGG
jgi:hypothetical protein